SPPSGSLRTTECPVSAFPFVIEAKAGHQWERRRTMANVMNAETFLPPIEKPQDRKSTRLNSSHLGISYAVFCLKKKTITKNLTITMAIQRFDSFISGMIGSVE